MTGTVQAGNRPADPVLDAHGVTVPSMFATTVARFPDAVAVRSGLDPGAGSLTWQQYREQVARAVTGLSHLGLSHGDRVVMMTTNRPEFHVADLAVAHLGGAAVSVYNSSAPEQIRYVVEHCGGRGLIVEERFLDRVLVAIRDVPTVGWLVVIGDASGGTVGGTVPSGATAWTDVLAAEPADLDAVTTSVTPDDLATVIYTSGATGPPKGVMLTHSCIAWQTTAMLARIDQPTDGWRAISYLPMAHIGERMMGHYLAIRGAMQVTCCGDPAGVHPFLAAVRPQIFLGMPRTWEKLHAELTSVIHALPAAVRREVDLALATPATRGALDEHTAVLASLRRQVGLGDGRVMLTGGGVLGGETHAFFRRLRLPLSDIYGMSESTGPISWSPYDSPPGRVGRPMPGCDVRIDVDGEVLFRSRTAFAGYLNDPERTAEAEAPDGFVRTGDIGGFDDDGWLRIVDRKKDLLITAGGKNVAPALLESALAAFPVIARVAVVGEQRPFVAALVTVDETAARALASAPDASLSELTEHAAVRAAIDDALAAVNAKYSRAEQIRRVVVLPEQWMPDSAVLTPTSKLKRRAVNDLYRDQIESLYATSDQKWTP